MNIGPTHDGRIVPIFEERLLQMGKLSDSIIMFYLIIIVHRILAKY